MGTNKKSGDICETTVSRRSLIQWLGKGCVLALGSSALSSCLSDLGSDEIGNRDGGLPSDGTRLPDGGMGESDQGLGELLGSESIDGFHFAPGEPEHPVYKSWGERTVDPQNLQSIVASWKLQVDGLVEQPQILSFVELLDLDRTDPVVDFHCVEGWSVYDVPWNGIHLSVLFERVKPTQQASYVTFHTIGNLYNESLPLSVALEPKTLLAYGIGGSTLPLKHGFPLRIVIPRLFGYKSAKYVQRIELTDQPFLGYWVKAGYPYDGEVPQSRLRPGKY